MVAGQTKDSINLIANESVGRLDLLGDDDEAIFTFPEGFSFPFFGRVYTEVIVNSDGNLTFGEGDSTPGLARSEERFLSGPPRVAPLFSDLDPSGQGRVFADTTVDGEVTLTWDGVPEFSESGNRPGNRFSVTLFFNGNIRLKFESIQVTPDADNLQAIVGITPGRTVPGSSQDLSTLQPVSPIADAPIYEVFTATTFDLASQEIFLQASKSRLLFPFYQRDAQTFSGYAITNLSSSDAFLQVEGRSQEGQFLEFPLNPNSEKIASQKQLAKLGSEFFNSDVPTLQRGWIRIISNIPRLGSLFFFGNGLAGPLTKMDGSLSFTEPSKVLYFTRLYAGLSSFPSLMGGRDAETFLSIANPNEEAVTLTFNLFGAAGEPIRPSVTRNLPPFGVLFESVTSIFELQSSLSQGFVRLDVSGKGAIGFEAIELADTLLALNASFGNQETVFYSAQLANGTAGVPIFTSLKLVNTADVPRSVMLKSFRQEGSTLGIFGPVILNPNQTFQRDVGEIFALGPSTGSSTTGSMKIEADGPGVIGDVLFGDPKKINFAAALPLQTTLFQKALFSQVANGAPNPADPSTRLFTGIALFNPNPESAEVTLKVFDREGNLVGQTTIRLSKNQRLSDVVENLIPATAGLIRGYIVIESEQPLAGQQLFGNTTLQFLSAVLPTVVK